MVKPVLHWRCWRASSKRVLVQGCCTCPGFLSMDEALPGIWDFLIAIRYIGMRHPMTCSSLNILPVRCLSPCALSGATQMVVDQLTSCAETSITSRAGSMKSRRLETSHWEITIFGVSSDGPERSSSLKCGWKRRETNAFLCETAFACGLLSSHR